MLRVVRGQITILTYGTGGSNLLLERASPGRSHV